MKTLSLKCLAICLLVLLNACIVQPNTVSPQSNDTAMPLQNPTVTMTSPLSVVTPFPTQVPGPYFRLYILADTLSDLHLDSHPDYQPVLKKVDLNRNIMVITEDDIQDYNWRYQFATLTPDASTGLRNAFSEYVGPRLSMHAFVVTLYGDWLYGGIFLEHGSARAVDFPVIYPLSDEEDRAVFVFRPKHDVNLAYQDFPESLKRVIELPALRDFYRVSLLSKMTKVVYISHATICFGLPHKSALDKARVSRVCLTL